jgi:hypothetical protein
MRSFLVAFLLMTLAACAGSGYFGRSPDTLVTADTVVALNQSLTIPRNAVAAPIRGGHIGTRYAYDGYCRLELRTLANEPRVVEADEFKVLRTTWEREYFGSLDPRNMYATLTISEGSFRWWYTTYIYLQSDRQPDIFRLQCRHLQQSDQFPRYLRVDQIQTLLGEVMTIRG